MRKEQEKMSRDIKSFSNQYESDADGRTIRWRSTPTIRTKPKCVSPDRKKAAEEPLAAGEAGQIQKDGPTSRPPALCLRHWIQPLLLHEPVVATIVAGFFQGAKILGQFTRNDARLALNFNTISIPCANTSQAVNVLAISVNNEKYCGKSSYIRAICSIMAAAFIDGAGNAEVSGATVVTHKMRMVLINARLTLTRLEIPKWCIGLGNIGDKLMDVYAPLKKQPTVTMREGGVFGLLFMSDFELPKQTVIE